MSGMGVDNFSFIAKRPEAPPPALPRDLVEELAQYLEAHASCRERDATEHELPEDFFAESPKCLRDAAGYLRGLYRREERRQRSDP